MNSTLIAGVFSILLSTCLAGQPNEDTPTKVTLCDLFTNPAQYAGKMVEFRGTLSGYRNPSVELPSFSKPESCSAYMTIVLELPQTVSPKPNFDLVRDEAFQKYEAAMSKPMRIEATLEGRFDPVFAWKDRKRVRIGEGPGFGKSHSADARLVLRKLSDVETRVMPRR